MKTALAIAGEALFLAALLAAVFTMAGSIGHTFGKHQCNEPHGSSAFASTPNH